MYQPWLPYVCLFAAALVATLLFTPLARRIAWRLGAVDYPERRRMNKVPIPRMGGLAILVGICAALLTLHLGSTHLGWPTLLTPAPHLQNVNYGVLGLGFLAIFITGVLDDIFQLKPLQKLAGQIVAALIAVASGVVIGVIVNPMTEGAFYLGIWTYPITVAYLVAYVNIFNLIDGLDGLASGLALIASLTMFILSAMAGRSDAAALSIALAGATLGFLRYNFNPASIFLGDCGSLLLGYALGVVSMLSVTRVAGLTTIIVPLVIAGIPIIDTFSAIVRRRRAHVSIGQADRGHIHHRLIAEGFNQRQAVLIMYAWTALLCLGTFFMTQVSVMPRIGIFLTLLVISILIATRLHLFRPVLLHHTNPRTGNDELIGPQDPAFEKEEEKFEEERHIHVPGHKG